MFEKESSSVIAMIIWPMKFPKMNAFGRSLLFAAICGALYGILSQLVARKFVKDSQPIMASYMVMSLAYVFVLPAVIGMVHVYIRSRDRLLTYVAAIFEPIIPATLCLVFSMLVHWEGLICLILAIPVMLFLAALGGLTMRIILKFRGKHLVFATFVFLPIPLSFAEQKIPLPQEMQIVKNSIVIRADANKVWQKIVRVEKITEPQNSFFFTMGFPKPIEALLTQEGVGGTRLATFERGLQFVERVTEWQANKKLAFSIQADPQATPLTTLDEHVTVGGAFFDVLSGTYEIEPVSSNEVRLVLYSRHRLSTHFNFYARIWSRYLMSEIQENILRVIKTRSEG